MSDVEFNEDKTFLKPLPVTNIPEKSIEGWFYKKFPGSIAIKRFVLTMVIMILFALAIFIFLLSYSNFN